MSGNPLDDRRRALEEAFFNKHNEVLRQRLHETKAAALKQQEITAATGIKDPVLLDKLAALDLRGGTLAALSLVPLIAVAWADGALDAEERAAILSSATRSGHGANIPSDALLQDWLSQPPPPALIDAWKTYTAGIIGTLDEPSRQTFKNELLQQARSIARASGGVLGLGSKVSQAEEAMLSQLEAAIA
jgi:hypothetical protein